MKRFQSPGQFAAFLAGRLALVEIAHHVAMKRAAQVIQEAVRDGLGLDHSGAGPFPAWDPLAPATIEDRVRRGLTPDNPLWATGELRDHIDMTAEGLRAVVGVPVEDVGDGSKQNPVRHIGDVAIDLEFGTSSMPARSFLGREAFIHGKDAAAEALAIVGAAVASVPVETSGPQPIPF